MQHTYPRRWAMLLACAGAISLATPAQAENLNPVLAGGLGAIAGALIGQSVGGRDGAILGGAIGGATGVALGSDAQRGEPHRRQSEPVYINPGREAAYYPPQQVLLPAPQEYRYGWRDHRHHGYDFERHDERRDEFRGNRNAWHHEGR